MKKIVILVLSLFLLTGCYDYVELNELSIITMITIDKNGNKYNISFEILNDEKDSERNQKNKSLIANGSGYTIASAIASASKNTPKRAYLGHLKVLAISKDVAKDDLKEVIEYFLRSPSVRNEFYLVITDNNASLLFNNDTIIISDVIASMLKENKNNYNMTTNNIFEDIIIDVFEKGKDASIPVINSDKKIKIAGTALLSSFKLKNILNTKDSSILNILTNNATNTLFTYKCPDGNNTLSLSVYAGKTNIKMKSKKVVISSIIEVEIEEYNCKDNLRDSDTFKEYNNYYSKLLKKDITKLYEKLQKENTDSLGIGRIIYTNKRKYTNNDWLLYKPIVKVNLKINKEGLIYEVKNGN